MKQMFKRHGRLKVAVSAAAIIAIFLFSLLQLNGQYNSPKRPELYPNKNIPHLIIVTSEILKKNRLDGLSMEDACLP